MIELLAAPEPEKVCHKICVTRRRTGNLGLSSRVTFCLCGITAMHDFPKVKNRVRLPAGTPKAHCQTPNDSWGIT